MLCKPLIEILVISDDALLKVSYLIFKWSIHKFQRNIFQCSK